MPRLIQRLAGWSLQVVGLLMGLWSGATLWALDQNHRPPSESPAAWAFASAVGVAGILALSIGKKLTTPRAPEALASDPRPPVLLLRSFADDEIFLPGQSAPPPLWAYFGTEETLEQLTAGTFSAVGPVIAIGRPGEKLPPLGAARLWVSNEEWKEQVEELLSRCRRVVMFLGDIKGNDGLAWEVEKIFGLSAPEKIVLIVPPISEDAVQARWQKYRERSHGRLPAYEGGEATATFSPEWRPDIRRVRVGLLRDGRDSHAYEDLLSELILSQDLVQEAPFGRAGGPGIDDWAVGVFAVAVILGTTMGSLPSDKWQFGWPGLVLIWMLVAGSFGTLVPILTALPGTIWLSGRYHKGSPVSHGSRKYLSGVHQGLRFGFGLAIAAGFFRSACEVVAGLMGSWPTGLAGSALGLIIASAGGASGAAMTALLRRVREDGT
jgi:hypothetical protein